MKKLITISLFSGFLSVSPLCLHAQEVVHALAGTVKNINQKAATIYIKTDDGSAGNFKDFGGAKIPVSLDKTINAEATPADKFTSKGDQVIAFYFGSGDDRTLVSLRDLGDGTLEKATGTVVKFDKREHLLTIKDSAGTEETFHTDLKTIQDTANGVVEGAKVDAAKGDQVRVTAVQTNGSDDALFIVPAN